MEIVTNDKGRKFGVRVVKKGDRHGRNDCLTHDKADPLIEFYDMSADPKKFGPRGQFVSSYYASTLAYMRDGTGLRLHGGVPEWEVDGATLRPVLTVARALAVPR